MQFLTNRAQFSFMYRYLYLHRVRLIQLFVFILINISLQIYSPHFIQKFIDSAKAGRETSLLLQTALIFTILTVVRQLVIIVIQHLTSDVTWKITNMLRLDLTRRCLDYDLSFHNQHSPGEMVDRIDGDAGRLNNFLTAFALKIISNNLLILGIVIVIFTINMTMGIVVAVSSIIGLYVLFRMGAVGTNTIRNYMAESADVIGYLDERISGREDIRAFKAETYVLRSYYVKLQSLYRTRKKTGFHIATVLNVGEMVLAIIMAAAILAMGILYLQSAELSTGTMFLIYYYITILLIPLKNIVYEVQDQQQVNASLQRINELLSYKSKVVATGSNPIDDSELSLRFDEVSFSYDGTNNVIHNVSFQLPANKTIGILGRTGSGKSTIARLIYRLSDAQKGTISINGTDIKQLELGSLRSHISIISQNVELFQGTLRDNITMYKEHVTDEEILQIMSMLSMDGWLSGIPDGLDMKIERDGKNLSAGEAQLLAFARAFLQTPRMVILDEATSRIDTQTEKILEKAIAALVQDRTTLIIAHRLSTIKKTDYLLILHDGHVIEYGETKKLEMDPQSEYSALLKRGGDLYE